MTQLGDRSKREQLIYDTGLDRRIWKKFFSNQGYFENQRRLNLFRKFLNIENREILELGGSMSKAYVYDNSILKHKLCCINISKKEIEESKLEYKSNDEKPVFIQMDAHELKFEDNSFDMVFGFGMLHHLDYEQTLAEVSRVLKAGGIAVFKEPLDENPVARLVRYLTPKARTNDEIPFKKKDLEKISVMFNKTEFHFDQFFTFPCALISRIFSSANDTKLIKFAFYVDNFVSRKISFLHPYYRQVTIVLHKEVK